MISFLLASNITKAVIGTEGTPGTLWGTSSLRIFKPGISLPTWLGRRSPDRLAKYARSAAGRGVKVIIAGAGGAVGPTTRLMRWLGEFASERPWSIVAVTAALLHRARTGEGQHEARASPPALLQSVELYDLQLVPLADDLVPGGGDLLACDVTGLVALDRERTDRDHRPQQQRSGTIQAFQA